MPDSDPELVTYDVRDGVAWARIDNGKANALSFDVLGGLDRCLTRAEEDAAVGALVITGTPGFLTGGFDLTVMQGDDPAAMIRLVSDGGALFTRLFASSVPVVVAAPGHAVAAGALMLLAADERIGADGLFKVGLIETQIGMFLPRWAIELAEERLSRRHFQVATVGARMYAPSGAVDAGYLDTVVAPEELEATAQAAAAAWAKLPAAAYAAQVRVIRSARIAALEAAVAADRANGASPVTG
jgi:enoyl-CoA hydratase